MEKKGYERLLKEESSHEAKLQRTQKKCATIIAKAKNESEQVFREILASSIKEVEQEQSLLEQQHKKYLSSLQEQTATYRKRMQHKEEQLSSLAKTVAHRFIEEWT